MHQSAQEQIPFLADELLSGSKQCIDRASPSTIGLGLLVATSVLFWSNAFVPNQFLGWWEGF